MTMQLRKYPFYWSLLLFAICFVGNIIDHQKIALAMIHSLVLVCSFLSFTYFAHHASNEIKERPIWHILPFAIVGLSPIATNDFGYLVSSIALASSLLLLLSFVFPKIRYIFYGLILILVAIGGLFASEMLTTRNFTTINLDRTIFSTSANMILVKYVNFLRGELDGNTLISKFLYNKATLYPYYFLTNLARFTTLSTLVHTLFLVNLYPLYLGIRASISSKTLLTFILLWLSIILFFMGINEKPNEHSIYALATPLFIFLISIGFVKMQMRIYLVALALTLFYFLKPTI